MAENHAPYIADPTMRNYNELSKAPDKIMGKDTPGVVENYGNQAWGAGNASAHGDYARDMTLGGLGGGALGLLHEALRRKTEQEKNQSTVRKLMRYAGKGGLGALAGAGAGGLFQATLGKQAAGPGFTAAGAPTADWANKGYNPHQAINTPAAGQPVDHAMSADKARFQFATAPSPQAQISAQTNFTQAARAANSANVAAGGKPIYSPTQQPMDLNKGASDEKQRVMRDVEDQASDLQRKGNLKHVANRDGYSGNYGRGVTSQHVSRLANQAMQQLGKQIDAEAAKSASLQNFGTKVALNLGSLTQYIPEGLQKVMPAAGAGAGMGALGGAALGGLSGLISPGHDDIYDDAGNVVGRQRRGRFGAMLRGALGGGAAGGLAGGLTGAGLARFAPKLTKDIGNIYGAATDPANLTEMRAEVSKKPLPEEMRIPSDFRKFHNMANYGINFDPVQQYRQDQSTAPAAGTNFGQAGGSVGPAYQATPMRYRG